MLHAQYPPIHNACLQLADAHINTTDYKQFGKPYYMIVLHAYYTVHQAPIQTRSLCYYNFYKQTGDILTYQRLKAFHGRSSVNL